MILILNKTGIKMCRNKLPFFDNFHFPQDVNFEIQVPKATVQTHSLSNIDLDQASLFNVICLIKQVYNIIKQVYNVICSTNLP